MSARARQGCLPHVEHERDGAPVQVAGRIAEGLVAGQLEHAARNLGVLLVGLDGDEFEVTPQGAVEVLSVPNGTQVSANAPSVERAVCTRDPYNVAFVLHLNQEDAGTRGGVVGKFEPADHCERCAIAPCFIESLNVRTSVNACWCTILAPRGVNVCRSGGGLEVGCVTSVEGDRRNG